MATYEPNAAATSDPQLADELRRISNASRSVIIPGSGAEPRRPVNGQMAYATGAWATALGAPGIYGYEEGSWIKL